MKWLAAAWVVVLIALHQDNWNWTDKTLVFGFMPIGLFYHACYAVAASLTMWMLVKVAWPKDLDHIQPVAPVADAAAVSAAVSADKAQTP